VDRAISTLSQKLLDVLEQLLQLPAGDMKATLNRAQLQRQLGLDVLPVSNGGQTVSVYQTGRTYLNGRKGARFTLTLPALDPA